MYKVFVNDKPIIITDSSQKKKNYPVYFFDEIIFDEIIYKLKKENLKGIYLFSNNLDKAWKDFKKNFKVIKAAGGLVLNQKKEILFIYRGNRWDLPKGRLEKGEETAVTAVREVEEECGVSELKIEKFLIKTYHIFYHYKEVRLKETTWYLMNTNFNGVLKPQLEEGITKVVFKDTLATTKALKNTYANIVLVYKSYKNLH